MTLPFQFGDFDVEFYFYKRLREHQAPIFDGVTDRSQRKERIREAIIAKGLDCVIIGKNQNNKPETYQQLFERFYSESLVPGQKRKGIANADTREKADEIGNVDQHTPRASRRRNRSGDGHTDNGDHARTARAERTAR